MLRLENITVAYGKHEALHKVSLDVEAGCTTVILGANGAGKTTLLNTIAGLMRPQPGGRIVFEDRAIEADPTHRMVASGIALVPEGRRLFGKMTVIDNLRMGAYTKHARAAEERRLEGVLAMFPRLAERRTQLANTMSGGEQQMVAIARALMSGPRLLLLDEPSLGLSPLLVKDLFATLHEIKERRQSVILVEQSVRQGLRLADYVYVLENGRIVRAGRPAEIEADRAIQKAYLGLAGARAAQATQPAVRAAPALAALGPVRVAADVNGAAAAPPRKAAPAPDTHPAHENREREMERRYAINRAFAGACDGFYHPFARTLIHAQPGRAPTPAPAPVSVVAVKAPTVRATIPTSGGFVNPQAMNPQARPGRL